MSQPFRFKQFSIKQDRCPMKVGTDGVLLGAWPEVYPNTSVLDIGTGTGLIALMLAQKEATAQVIGVEIDEIAAAQAMDNVNNSPFARQTKIKTIAIQEFSQLENEKFDLIVSNPPFFTGGVLSDNMERMNVRHTIKLSHQDLLRSVQCLLKIEGRFCVVLPWLEGLRFQELAEEYRLITTKKCIISPRPNQSPNRLLLEMKLCATYSDRQKMPTEEISKMSIYADVVGEERSTTFQEMTQAYYL